MGIQCKDMLDFSAKELEEFLSAKWPSGAVKISLRGHEKLRDRLYRLEHENTAPARSQWWGGDIIDDKSRPNRLLFAYISDKSGFIA